jgi:succinyl-CoA--D-citramalate CoA-transferase
MKAAGPLDGIKVLELGSMLAGPFLGALLADFGAEVIKLEKPGKPDPLREWPPHKGEVPLWWKTMARNKRLATLDISRPEARELALQLIGRSDVVIENFRPATLERWGLAPAQLETEFPRVVWARVSGYGQTGPFSGQGGFATIAECFAGLAAITGFPDRGPMVSAFPLGDYLAGTFGAYGVMAALRERDRSGRGQVVDVSLFEPLMRILESLIVRYDQTGQTKPRLGNQMEEDVPRNIYATADGGYIAISCGSQGIFDNLMDAIGRAELKSDRRFGSMSARVVNRAAIDGVVAEWIARQPTEAALARLLACGVVAGKVNDIAETLSHPQVVARGAIVCIADAELGAIRMPAPAPQLGRTPGEIRWAGGRPGADNDYVFAEVLAIARGEVERLEQIGVI